MLEKMLREEKQDLKALSHYSWAKLALLACLEAEFPTKKDIWEAKELEGAVIVSVSGVVLSWEEICDLSGEDKKIRKGNSLLQEGLSTGRRGLLCCPGLFPELAWWWWTFLSCTRGGQWFFHKKSCNRDEPVQCTSGPEEHAG